MTTQKRKRREQGWGDVDPFFKKLEFQNWIWPWQWGWGRILGKGKTHPLSQWMAYPPTRPVRQLSPETTKWLGALPPEERQLWLAQWARQSKEQRDIGAVGARGSRISDIPIARKQQGVTLQTLFSQLSALRAQTGLPSARFPSPPVITDYPFKEKEMELRVIELLEKKGIPEEEQNEESQRQALLELSEFDEETYYRDSLKWYENQIGQTENLLEQLDTARRGFSATESQRMMDKASQWEADRRTILEGLPTGPEGDVARWFLQTAQGPSRFGELSFEEAMAGQSEASKRATVEANEAGKLKGPPTPSWLPEFVPGTQAGAPLGWGQAILQGGKLYKHGEMPFVPTPSRQQYTKMAPSQERWLSGAINWFGGRSWEDILNEMESMQPQTPRGAGQRRWRPPSQRVAV